MLTAIVLIVAEAGTVPEVAARVVNLPGVTDCFSVAGDYDLVALVRVKTHDALADAIADGVAKVPGIARTNTLIAFREYSRNDLEQAFAIGLE